MPHELLKHLDERAARVVHFRDTLKDVPAYLERAETSFRLFKTLRDKVFEEAPRLYETKGILAGLRRAPTLVQVHKDRVKKLIEDEKIAPEVGKPTLKELAALDVTLMVDAEQRKDELTRLAGKLDGYYAAALEALDAIDVTLGQLVHSKSIEEDEEDWSGRGTANGQREVKKPGGGVKRSARAKSNGTAKRKPAVRKPKKSNGASAPGQDG